LLWYFSSFTTGKKKGWIISFPPSPSFKDVSVRRERKSITKIIKRIRERGRYKIVKERVGENLPKERIQVSKHHFIYNNMICHLHILDCNEIT
jgi:hypothetical protein